MMKGPVMLRDVSATAGELLCWMLVCHRSKAARRVLQHPKSRAFRNVIYPQACAERHPSTLAKRQIMEK